MVEPLGLRKLESKRLERGRLPARERESRPDVEKKLKLKLSSVFSSSHSLSEPVLETLRGGMEGASSKSEVLSTEGDTEMIMDSDSAR